ncbi:Meckelin and transmembrane domain-containing protein [Spironucleus salmonicida]|nr:Meckelin and transmembrane domain-containing protein [Spironucleus salmonicida]
MFDQNSFTCPAGATCTTNQPFSGDCVGPGVLQSKCQDGESVVFTPMATCGILQYTPAVEVQKAQKAPCTLPLVYSQTLQQCVVVTPPGINLVNGSNTYSLHIAEANQLCQTKGSIQACDSLWNFCSLPFQESVQYCQFVQQAAGFDSTQFIDVVPSISRSEQILQHPNFMPTVLKNPYFPYNGVDQIGWMNIMNITAVFTDLYGTVLLKTKFDIETLDMCNILESGINPLIQKIRRYADVTQRDRRLNFGYISRTLMHQSTQMIKRFSQPKIQTQNKESPALMFGNNYQKICRIGVFSLLKITQQNAPIFVQLYTGNTNDTSTRLVVNSQLTQTLSFPLFFENLFANQIIFTINGNKNNQSFYPQIDINYNTIDQNIVDGPLLNRVITKLTQSNLNKNFSRQSNFIDFSLIINYSSNNVQQFSYRSIFILIIGWFSSLIYSFSQSKKLSGLGKNPFNGSKNGAIVLLYIFFMMVFGVGFGMLIDIIIFQCIYFNSPINILSGPESSLEFVGIECLVSGIFIFIPSLFIVLFSHKSKFVILDHGGPACYRKLFVSNAIQKLIRYHFFDYTLIFLLSFFILYGLDFQYFGAFTSTPINSPHNLNLTLNSTITAFVVFFSFIFVSLIIGIYRCCTGSPYDKFIDMLPVANCSVFVFDTDSSAILLYGRSPFGDTDGDCYSIIDGLQREARGLAPRRGIHGGSAQSFRVYFSVDCPELYTLSEACGKQLVKEQSVSGPVGDQSVDTSASIENRLLTLEIPYFSKQKGDNLIEIEQLALQALQLISHQPIRYVPKFQRLFDINFSSKANALLVLSDPTRNISPRGNNSGARLPGGFGGASWLASSFYYSRWFMDCLFSASFSALIVQISNNSALGLSLSWLFLVMLRAIWVILQRKRLGLGTLVSEILMSD